MTEGVMQRPAVAMIQKEVDLGESGSEFCEWLQKSQNTIHETN
jgi:hypothetical protein